MTYGNWLLIALIALAIAATFVFAGERELD